MRACAFMVVRDELPIIEENIRWHLDLGFDGLVILNHASNDGTAALLESLAQDERIQVLHEENPAYDHELYANRALSHAVDLWNPEWLFPLDADEFLVLSTPLGGFLDAMEHLGVYYGSIKWLNALPVASSSYWSLLETVRFYEPWPERSWENEGHYRKSFCRLHEGIEVVVGGHYFRWEKNPAFFGATNNSPIPLSLEQARLLHFDRRGTPSALLAKWRTQANHLVEPRYAADAPWREKLSRMKELASRYSEDSSALVRDWFQFTTKTFWGTDIPWDRIQTCHTLRDWYEHSSL